MLICLLLRQHVEVDGIRGEGGLYECSRAEKTQTLRRRREDKTIESKNIEILSD